jgi:hypothetical protein
VHGFPERRKLAPVFDLEAEDYSDTYLSVSECAKAMNSTEEQIRRFAEIGALRTRPAGRGVLLVQPANVIGWTT